MITNALEGKKPPVYGVGLYKRDWIFVEDHCRGLDHVLCFARAGEVHNTGYGAPLADLEVVRELLHILGKSEDLTEFLADRPGYDCRDTVSTCEISRDLG
jgi:dTDP-glucose 4,6-dehydratase